MKTVNLEKLLPADIPPGEQILWHGRPEWVSLTRRAFRADFIAAYFVAMTVWNAGSIGYDAGALAGAAAGAKTLAAGIAAILLLSGLAWLSARTTLYVITTRRLVMKVGIALPIFFNLPYTQIASASMRTYTDGTGDIPVALGAGQRIAYLQLWPHARPFRINRTEPAMRSVRNAPVVAETLAKALLAASGQTAPVQARQPSGARASLGETPQAAAA